MNLQVTRRWKDAACNEGELALDGMFECYTLELPDGRCIPTGSYRVTIERSPRFSALAGHDVYKPRLHGVPRFDGVLIHEGNTARDTEGCILVGVDRLVDDLERSRVAFDSLFLKLNEANARGEELWLTVSEGTAP